MRFLLIILLVGLGGAGSISASPRPSGLESATLPTHETLYLYRSEFSEIGIPEIIGEFLPRAAILDYSSNQESRPKRVAVQAPDSFEKIRFVIRYFKEDFFVDAEISASPEQATEQSEAAGATSLSAPVRMLSFILNKRLPKYYPDAEKTYLIAEIEISPDVYEIHSREIKILCPGCNGVSIGNPGHKLSGGVETYMAGDSNQNSVGADGVSAESGGRACGASVPGHSTSILFILMLALGGLSLRRRKAETADN